MTLDLFKNLKRMNETILDVSTGGFLKVSSEPQTDQPPGAQALRPVMTDADHENIKQKLKKID